MDGKDRIFAFENTEVNAISKLGDTILYLTYDRNRGKWPQKYKNRRKGTVGSHTHWDATPDAQSNAKIEKK